MINAYAIACTENKKIWKNCQLSTVINDLSCCKIHSVLLSNMKCMDKCGVGLEENNHH